MYLFNIFQEKWYVVLTITSTPSNTFLLIVLILSIILVDYMVLEPDMPLASSGCNYLLVVFIFKRKTVLPQMPLFSPFTPRNIHIERGLNLYYMFIFSYKSAYHFHAKESSQTENQKYNCHHYGHCLV